MSVSLFASPLARLGGVTAVKNDFLSGLTVALALVPEAVAFAFVAGVEPLVGLYAAFMVGLITAVMGGRPGMISGATGALAVVMVALVADHGVEYLFITVVLMGFLQLLAGWFKLGKFIRMVPHPVMLGFVNGLAIVIFLAQLNQFGVAGEAGWLADTALAGSIIDVAWLQGSAMINLLLLVAATATGSLKNIVSARQYTFWVTPASGFALVAGGTYGFLSRVAPYLSHG